MTTVPENGRTFHIYSFYCRHGGPKAGDPVLFEYDGFNELFFGPEHVERKDWPVNGEPGVVLGGLRIPNQVEWFVHVLAANGKTYRIASQNLLLDVERCDR